MEFVYIPPGKFLMGSLSSEPGRSSDEGPQHEVTITQGFYLGKYEVTQGQWESVMGTRPWSGQDYVQENPDHPTVYVSWNDAQAFVTKLNQAAGSDLYRLPAEAEWEYACRAGTTTRWSFGDDQDRLGEYAWYTANAWYAGKQYAQKVGTKKPNPWGLYDMHGNVWEWCQDWYGPYSSSPHVDPTGRLSGSRRVVRGCSFHGGSSRSANRSRRTPSCRNGYLGLRLLMRAE
jgi:formylglycine-generating enzyme required for sulfatase activity